MMRNRSLSGPLPVSLETEKGRSTLEERLQWGATRGRHVELKLRDPQNASTRQRSISGHIAAIKVSDYSPGASEILLDGRQESIRLDDIAVCKMGEFSAQLTPKPAPSLVEGLLAPFLGERKIDTAKRQDTWADYCIGGAVRLASAGRWEDAQRHFSDTANMDPVLATNLKQHVRFREALKITAKHKDIGQFRETMRQLLMPKSPQLQSQPGPSRLG